MVMATYAKSTEDATNYYPLRQRRSDDKLREKARNEALLQAAAEGQTVRVNKLLKDGADVDFVGKYGWTALHHAAYSGFEDTAQDLLAAGADVNARSEYFGTPLALAAVKGRFNVAKTLLKSRASILTPCGKLGSVMHAACAGGNVEFIETLIERGADLIERHKFDKTIVDMLLGSQDVGNYLDFENALESEAAFSRDSTPDFEYGTCWLDSENEIFLDEKLYTSAINIAALCGNCDALVFLSNYIIESPTLDADTITRTLYYTAAFGQIETLRSFFGFFSGFFFIGDTPLGSEFGSLAVIAAAHTGNYTCLQYLLEQGASAHPNRNRGMTALLWAASKGHVKCVELLVERDHPDEDWANFDSHGATPLMDAAHGGHLDCVRILLRKGASIEPPQSSGRNALHCAAEYGHVVIIEELVKAGIDVNSLDNDGWTPLMCSLYDQEWGFGEIFKPRRYVVEKLIALGADATINNIAHVLEEKGRQDALPWLEKKERSANQQ
jgi:ankyrin repeat protein